MCLNDNIGNLCIVVTGLPGSGKKGTRHIRVKIGAKEFPPKTGMLLGAEESCVCRNI